MRIIAHLDMDAFFAAIEERDTPQWHGLPIVIGANPQSGKGRGVVSTANYKAREYGIKSALPINKAWQFSQWAKQRGKPPAVFIEPDIEKYAEVSEQIVKIVRSVLDEELCVLPERVRQLTDESKAVKKTLRPALRPLRRSSSAAEGEPRLLGREASRRLRPASPELQPASPELRLGEQGEQAQGIRDYKVEQAGIDEMYVDLSLSGSYKKAIEICKKIKKEIKDKERLTASVGIGPNKLVAKIASDQQKPDGLTIVIDKEAIGFLEPLPIRAIPGIGPKTEEKLSQMGITLVRNLKKMSLEEMKNMFGKWGIDMYYKARGIDESLVEEGYIAKSIGEQETFLKDTLDPNFIVDRLALMCENIIKRLKNEGFKNFRTIVITVRFAGFITKTRSHTFKKPANSLETLKFEAIKLLMPFFDNRGNPENKLIRLIGVRVEKLE